MNKLTNIVLKYYLNVAQLDSGQDVESLIGAVHFISDWSYAIPYLIIDDEKEF
jgi:hypothetical protein